MNRTSLRGVLPLVFLYCSSAVPVLAVDAFTVNSTSVQGTTAVSMDVLMDNDVDVQGVVLAIGYDNTLVEVTGVDIAGDVAGENPLSPGDPFAELVVGELFHAEGGFTLGVVFDAVADFDGQSIPVGAGQLIASFEVMPLGFVLAATDTSFDFVDGVFNDPPLSNLQVQAGLSIGAGEGLVLQSGTLTLLPPEPAELLIESATIASDGCGGVRILMSNTQPVQGFVLAISHDASGVSLNDISLDGTVTASVGAEFSAPDISPGGGDGGTLGVVLDFVSPFLGQTIPDGSDQHIATFEYCCADEIFVPDPDLTTSLTFVDGVLGDPPLDNVVVIAGASIEPQMTDGTVTCAAIQPGEVLDLAFRCGGPGDAFSPIAGTAGETVDICFYYESPENVQGFQLAVCFDCCLTLGTFTIEGSILDEVGAEFMNFNIDQDPHDGDGCELVVGILLDALPPFGGQTVPATTGGDPLLIGCIDATICEDAECDSCLAVEFCNDIDGAGDVDIQNIMVIDFTSQQDIEFFDCEVCVTAVPEFKRGDCNNDDKCDLADAASVLGEQFFGLEVDCEDGCDVNDDGKINLADSVFLLNYLFKFGDPPLDPGCEEPGPDPTDDMLTCETGVCP